MGNSIHLHIRYFCKEFSVNLSEKLGQIHAEIFEI